MTWPGNKRDHLGRLELMATYSYETLLDTLAHLVNQNACCIVLHAYALRDVAELLPELNPRWVLATRLRDATPQTKVLRQRRDPGPAHVALCDQHRPGWGDAFAALGVAPGGDAAEDFCDGVMTEHSDSHSELGSQGVGSSRSGLSGMGDDVAGDVGDDEADLGAGEILEVVDSDIDMSSSSGSSSCSGSSSSESAPAPDGPPMSPPPLPPPLEPAPAVAVRDRSKCDREIILENGILRCYNAPTRKFLVAHCTAHGVDNCRLTRTVLGNDRAGREGQGRPLGYLLAWMAVHEEYADGYQHVREHAPPTLEQRQVARLAAQDHPDLRFLMESAERPRRPEEPDEPAWLP